MHLLSVIPEWFYQESKQWEGTRPIVPNRRTKREKARNVDSRLKISGMTGDVDASLNFENDG